MPQMSLLAQRAVNELRAETGDKAYTFIAVRLPYQVQEGANEQAVFHGPGDKLYTILRQYLGA